MHNRRKHLIAVLSTAALLSVFSTGSHAQSFPTKPVRIVVPYAAGGPVDTLARALGMKLGEIWKQPVIVDNKPGANEVIGATTVAKSDPDGHTLILATDPTLSLNPFLFKKLSYDAFKDLAPITRVAVSNMAFVVPANTTANSMKDFVAYAKANPGKVSYGSSGIGNGTHLAMAAFSKDNNVEMVHVPYKGLAPTLQDMMAGNIQAAVGAVSVIAPFATTGKLKVLGISGPKRAAAFQTFPPSPRLAFRSSKPASTSAWLPSLGSAPTSRTRSPQTSNGWCLMPSFAVITWTSLHWSPFWTHLPNLPAIWTVIAKLPRPSSPVRAHSWIDC
ncbi:Argininosuccinate lyase [Hydrogenophaga sp. T4]|nr:Argininosuccinate lyase [Hydrogenophaga sp. T4]